jgi:hypothetical protein
MSARASRDPLAPLSEALGRRPPDALATLPGHVLDELVVAVHDARRIQAENLAASLDSALRIAPRPLRSVLKKLLF